RVERGRLEVAMESFAVSLAHRETTIGRAPYAGIAMRLDDLDLAKPLERYAASIDVPSATISNVASLAAYTELPFESGATTVSAHADVDPHGVSGRAKLDWTTVSVKLPRGSAMGGGHIDIALRRFDFDRARGEIENARIDVRDVAYDQDRGWWANVATGPFSFQTSRELSAAVMLTGKCRDASVPLGILGVPRIASALVGGRGFTVSARGTVSPSTLDASDVRVVGDALELDAHYHATAQDKHGAALLVTKIANVGCEIGHGDVSVRPFASRDWYERTRHETVPAAREAWR
ncbi:MAG TPA: hypothetical protein VGH87_21845, partial [Polyangiaceae bacterium]